jgi:predicted ribosomally synthesized peptide with SipW-like signal peptide
MRRVLVGVAAGAVLALVATTGVSAYWQAQHVVAVPSTQSGDLDIQVAWAGGTTWGAIGPGTTISKRATITVVGSGTTLRARLTGTATNAAAFTSHVSRSISLDDCSGAAGTALPVDGYPSAGGLAPGATVTVCVRYTLSASAPATLQGQDLAPQVTFQLRQRSGP